MGSGAPEIPKGQGMGKVLRAYARWIPSVLQSTSSSLPDVARGQLNAAQATEPGYQQLNTDLTRQFAPQLADINSGVQRQQALAGAETTRQQLMGPGGATARAAVDLARETNPNYYGVQDAASQKAREMLGTFNLTGLSPGETNAVERSLAQTNSASGNLGLINPTNVVSNAMNFGGAFNNKVDRLNAALGTATNVAGSAQNTGVNPVNIALGQPNTTGMTQFQQSGTQTGASNNAFGFGQSALGTMGGTNQAAIGGQSQFAVANSAPAYLGAMPSYS